MKKNKLGFTLLEIMVVIIIVGILAALGLGKYRKSIEKGIANEAYTTINVIRALEEDFFIENNNYTADTTANGLNFTMPTCDDDNHYFSYSIPKLGGPNFSEGVRIQATRCVDSGKSPQGKRVYNIIFDIYADGRVVDLSTGP